jgi:cbb3-type cytochrome oxidase subunit 3
VKSDLLARSPLLVLPLVALFLFIVVFVAMVIVTMRKRARNYEPLARLPLEDEDVTDETRDDVDDPHAHAHAHEGAPR